MGGSELEIDFSKGITYWMDVINTFIKVVSDFFSGIGIKLFDDNE